MASGDVVRLQGPDQFRQRVILSILSARVLRIDEIRSNEERPGLRDYEANFLRLISKITNGTYVYIFQARIVSPQYIYIKEIGKKSS